MELTPSMVAVLIVVVFAIVATVVLLRKRAEEQAQAQKLNSQMSAKRAVLEDTVRRLRAAQGKVADPKVSALIGDVIDEIGDADRLAASEVLISSYAHLDAIERFAASAAANDYSAEAVALECESMLKEIKEANAEVRTARRGGF